MSGFFIKNKKSSFQAQLKVENLFNLYQSYETIRFEEEMRKFIKSRNFLLKGRTDRLLFNYVNSSYQGGKVFKENIYGLMLRGSKLALFSNIFLRYRFAALDRLIFRYLAHLSIDMDQILRFFIRLGMDNHDINRLLRNNTLSNSYRVFKHLAPDQVNFIQPEKLTFSGESKIFFYDLIGTRQVEHKIILSKSQEVQTFKSVITYGKSSLIIRGEYATLPWLHFELAEENICRNDPLLIALNSKCILTRALPSRLSEISESSISLSSPDSHHFGHFVLEGLSRLRATKLKPSSTNQVTIKLDGDSMRFLPLIKDIAPDCKVVEVEKNQGIHHKELFVSVPSRFLASDLTFGSPFDQQDYVISQSDYEGWDKLNSSNGPRVKNLSLLRKGTGEANYRHLTNHKELISTMNRYDFKFVDRESVSYENLRKEITTSRIIVTEASASISFNLLFFNLEGVWIIFFQHPSLMYQESRLPGLLSARGARVHVIKGTALGNERQSSYYIDNRIFQSVLIQISG